LSVDEKNKGGPEFGTAFVFEKLTPVKLANATNFSKR
jgi:hypothetical protein